MSAYVGADYIQYYSRLVIISVPIIHSKLLGQDSAVAILLAEATLRE